MSKFAAVALLAVSAVITTPVTEAADAGRYTMRQTENGFLRLDSQTGAVSACTSEDGAWACRTINDDSRALQDEIEQLGRDNADLRRENSRLKAELDAKSATEEPRTFNERPSIPTEKDIDKAFSFMERMLQKFKQMVEDLKDDSTRGTPL